MGNEREGPEVILPAGLLTTIGTYKLSDIELGVFVRLCFITGCAPYEFHLQELGDALGYTKQHIGRLLRRFSTAGLIEYWPSTNRHSPSQLTVSPDVTVNRLTVSRDVTVESTVSPDVTVDSGSDQGCFDAEFVNRARTTNTKNVKGKRTRKYEESSREFQLSKLLLDRIRDNLDPGRSANLQTWALHIDRLHRIDQRPYEHIEAIIRWLYTVPGTKDSRFWRGVVLSTRSLREHFPTMVVQYGMHNLPQTKKKQGRKECPTCEGRAWLLDDVEDVARPCTNPDCENGWVKR